MTQSGIGHTIDWYWYGEKQVQTFRLQNIARWTAVINNVHLTTILKLVCHLGIGYTSKQVIDNFQMFYLFLTAESSHLLLPSSLTVTKFKFWAPQRTFSKCFIVNLQILEWHHVCFEIYNMGLQVSWETRRDQLPILYP